MNFRTISIAVVVAIVTAGFLGYTTAGHRLLNMIGIATADCSSCG